MNLELKIGDKIHIISDVEYKRYKEIVKEVFRFLLHNIRNVTSKNKAK